MPQNVSVNGVIRRSDGKNTIWLNNRVVGDHQAAGLSATLGRNDNRVRLSVAESGRNIDLKVGQTVEIVSGTIGESYLRRPATKLDVKTLPATAPDGTSAPKDAPPQAATPVAVDRGIQRDSTRAAPVDAKLNNGIGQK